MNYLIEVQFMHVSSFSLLHLIHSFISFFIFSFVCSARKQHWTEWNEMNRARLSISWIRHFNGIFICALIITNSPLFRMLISHTDVWCRRVYYACLPARTPARARTYVYVLLLTDYVITWFVESEREMEQAVIWSIHFENGHLIELIESD